MILHVFTSFSAVLMYDLTCSVYLLIFFTIDGYITNSQRDQLPVSLMAQLVEHCTGITGHCFESRSSLNVFQPLINLTTSCAVYNADDLHLFNSNTSPEFL